ncbi:phosphohydrolase [Malaciobacter halophilus]|uniref:Phosphohydrolase n=1 Tax=Malaciobacter halophilus TaxID=197482 RepID=A0A2N1J4Q6_9BACT|nr:HD domain-containing protein [Malaciobacter halophilus]AXH10162.1 bifunctional (p)ppGpp synthetase/guanosine-3',5'-bis(diphosphate) 3'-pyrophosphohydrolase [Malaciobacter halophilus]PKI81516.1 phosphohydrolase [Malaciobacter halophilus]
MFSQEEYLKALRFAAKAHKEQKTPYGLPYLTHVTSVAMEVIHASIESKLDDDKANKAISCALLHDVLEDTDMTFDDIFNEFGLDIAEGVEALSKYESLPKKQQMQDSLNRILEQPYEIQLVKLADRITNLQKPPKDWDNEKKKAYLKEAKFILSCLKNSNLYLSARLEKKIEDYNQYID